MASKAFRDHQGHWHSVSASFMHVLGALGVGLQRSKGVEPPPLNHVGDAATQVGLEGRTLS